MSLRMTFEQARHTWIQETVGAKAIGSRRAVAFKFTAGLELVDTFAVLQVFFELSIIHVTVLVLHFALAVQQAVLEKTLVRRAILVIDHALSVLRVVLPLTHVHVTVRVLAEPVALELPVDKVALVADATILDKHAETVVLAVPPFSFIVLALILPHIDAIAVKVVLFEFTLESMASALENEDTKAAHDGGRKFI